MLSTAYPFAFQFSAKPHQPYHAYLPATPSPLSPRSANVYGRRSEWPAAPAQEWVMDNNDNSTSLRPQQAPQQPMQHQQKEQTQSSTHQQSKQAHSQPTEERQENIAPISFAFCPTPTEQQPATAHASQRVTPPRSHFTRRSVAKPPVPTSTSLRQQRRENYFNNVAEQRWDRRAEDMLRLEFLRRQRSWERGMQTTAPAEDELVEDEDEMDVIEDEKAAEALKWEERQVEELVGLLGSDDEWGDEGEDIDGLFEELMGQQQRRQVAEQTNTVPQSSGEAMDMS